MKQLKDIVQEKLTIGSKTKVNQYHHPKNISKLIEIIKERLKKDKDSDLNDIDVSNITNMNTLFYGLDPHNIDISKWDVSNVEDMGYMFYGCENFNCDISNWDVSNVKTMRWMFNDCKKFNADLSNWDVRNVEDTRRMFNGCISLKNKPSWYKE